MKLVPLLAASALLVLAGCSSEIVEEPPEQDKGLEDDGVAAAPDTNPDGVPYPTDNIGTLPRRGKRLGNRIANFKFLGYPNADVSGGLQPVSLAQFYDPSGERYRIIHIQAAGVWCSACKAETTAVVPLKAELDSRKAVWLVSIAEGPTPGTPSTEKDLKGWIAQFKPEFTHMLDPGNKNLGPFYNAAALPWNANIDARTMEILTAGTGAQVEGSAILRSIDSAIATSDKTKLQ